MLSWHIVTYPSCWTKTHSSTTAWSGDSRSIKLSTVCHTHTHTHTHTHSCRPRTLVLNYLQPSETYPMKIEWEVINRALVRDVMNRMGQKLSAMSSVIQVPNMSRFWVKLLLFIICFVLLLRLAMFYFFRRKKSTKMVAQLRNGSVEWHPYVPYPGLVATASGLGARAVEPWLHLHYRRHARATCGLGKRFPIRLHTVQSQFVMNMMCRSDQ